MPIINPNQMRGWVDVVGVNIGTNNVTVVLPNGTFRFRRPIGYISVRLGSNIEATDSLPILFSVNRSTLPLTGLNNVPITASDFNQPGIYLIYYNKSTKTLQLMAPYNPSGATTTQNNNNS